MTSVLPTSDHLAKRYGINDADERAMLSGVIDLAVIRLPAFSFSGIPPVVVCGDDVETLLFGDHELPSLFPGIEDREKVMLALGEFFLSLAA